MADEEARAKILVVDDVRQQRESLKRILSKKYDVELASSVAEARDSFKLEAFDVAVVDFHMPDEDGTFLVSDLRQHLSPDRIFLLTADAVMGEAVVNTGDYTYFPKEDADTLGRFIEIALRGPKL